MKRWIAVVCAMVMVTMMMATGCSKEPASDVVNEDIPFAPVADTMGYIETLIDVSHYELDDSCIEHEDVPYVEYTLLPEYVVDEPLMSTISFEDGSALSLPMTGAEIAQSGWTLQETSYNPTADELVFINEDEEQIVLTDDNNENIDLADVSFVALSMAPYLAMYEDTLYIERNPVTPAFTFMDTLTQDATLDDIIAVVGEPHTIVVYNNELNIFFRPRTGSVGNNLTVKYTIDGNYMLYFDYECKL